MVKLRRAARRHGRQQYKNYFLVLLFIKYVSDKYAGQPRIAATVR